MVTRSEDLCESIFLMEHQTTSQTLLLELLKPTLGGSLRRIGLEARPHRSFKARTQRKLTHALAKALTLVTETDIRGWFEHCGYVSSLK